MGMKRKNGLSSNGQAVFVSMRTHFFAKMLSEFKPSTMRISCLA